MLALLQQLKLLVLQMPGRISKVLESGVHMAPPPVEVQQGQSASVTAAPLYLQRWVQNHRQARAGEEGQVRNGASVELREPAERLQLPIET